MAINVFANQQTIGYALQTVSFASAGITVNNTLSIFLIDGSTGSYVPTRSINAITGFEAGKGYLIKPKQDIDLSAVVKTGSHGKPVYYVRQAGLNTGTGSSESTAISFSRLLTLAGSFTGIETICFKAGEAFNGSIPAKAGNTITRYGSGLNPLIKGVLPASNLIWSQNGNIWSAPYANRVTQMFRGGLREKIAESNFYTVTGGTGTSVLTASSAAGLGSWVIDAEMVSKEYNFRWSYYTISAYNSGTGAFTLDRATGTAVGDSFRLINHPNLIVNDGDWSWINGIIYYRSPGNVNPGTLDVEFSAFDEGVKVEDNASNILIKGVDFKGQALDGIYAKGVTGLKIEDFNISFCNNSAIALCETTHNTIIQKGIISNIGNNGIYTGLEKSFNYNNLVISEIGTQHEPPVIRNTNRYVNTYNNGRTSQNVATTGNGIYNPANADNGVIEAVKVHDVAYIGIFSQAPNITVKDCEVYYFLKRMHDGSGIYTGADDKPDLARPLDQQFGIEVVDNFKVLGCYVHDVIGSREGQAAGEILSFGIYFDNGTINSSVENCVVITPTSYAGILYNFYNKNNKVLKTTSRGKVALMLSNYTSIEGFPVADGHVVEDNTFISSGSGNNCIGIFDYESGGFNPFSNGGNCQNNIFNSPNPIVKKTINAASSPTVTQLSLAQAITAYGKTFGTQV